MDQFPGGRSFPASQTAINVYLRRFNAAFRLDSVTSTPTRGGPACTYNVVINERPVPIGGGSANEGEPSFRNTLSSGDRNTLALSFFFASLEIARDGNGSTIRPWNVAQDSITEHDRRSEQLREYVERGAGDRRDMARAIRPHLEAFLRVACPEQFPPGTLLGPFLGICRQRVGQSNEVLSQTAIEELGELVEYANRFHHDTNPAWETELINDAELRDHVQRTLAFARR